MTRTVFITYLTNKIKPEIRIFTYIFWIDALEIYDAKEEVGKEGWGVGQNNLS
jgi:hypothetical protein